MAVTVTNTTLDQYNSEEVVTFNPATADVADTEEVFTIKPTRGIGKVAVFIKVGPTNGAVAFSVAAGTFWAATSAYTGSVAQDTTEVFVLENAKFAKEDGKIEITLTPAAGKKLKTDHAASVYVVELP